MDTVLAFKIAKEARECCPSDQHPSTAISIVPIRDATYTHSLQINGAERYVGLLPDVARMAAMVCEVIDRPRVDFNVGDRVRLYDPDNRSKFIEGTLVKASLIPRYMDPNGDAVYGLDVPRPTSLLLDGNPYPVTREELERDVVPVG